MITGKPKELASQLFMLDPEKEYDLQEHETKIKRSNNANRYFHKLINELARYNRNSGYAISDEEMKININTSYGTMATTITIPHGTDITKIYEYAKLVKTSDKYDGYVLYKRTSELNSKEFWQLIKGLEQECRDAGIETLDDIKLKELMAEYEKERCYE